jgi:4-methylaminobutanoate oxidase (formaldehyde-forming)
MVPKTADTIIIGGGIIGLAVAYYLSRYSSGSVVLIERGLLAEQNTSRAAALLTLARTKTQLIPLIKETYRVIDELEENSGETLGLRRNGSLHVFLDPKETAYLDELRTIARDYKIDFHQIRVSEAAAKAPWLSQLENGRYAFFPEDAFIDPYNLAYAFAKAAKKRGTKIVQNCNAHQIEIHAGKVDGVRTDDGFISAPVVIDAAGAWAGILSRAIGCNIPMAPVRSHYWITAPHKTFPRTSPIVIIPEARAYARPELGSLLFGIRESQCLSLDPLKLPGSMQELVINKDQMGWNYLEEGFTLLSRFFPAIKHIGIAHYIEGLSTYTPDGLFTVGPAPGINGFYAATGCSGGGIAGCGGIGLMTAEMALGIEPSLDPMPFRLDRFGDVDPFDQSFRDRCARARAGKTSG